MKRTISLVTIFLLVSILALPWANPNTELDTEIVQFSGDPIDTEQFIIYNQWQLQSGDYIELDDALCDWFEEMLTEDSGNPADPNFDRVTINNCNYRFEVMDDQSCDFNGTAAICHVVNLTLDIDLIAFNDSENYQLELVIEVHETNFIHSDLNGWEKYVEVSNDEYTLREQSSGAILDEGWSWENYSNTEYITGIPESIKEGDSWIESIHRYEEYTHESEDGDNESGSDEYWHNDTVEAYDFVQIDLPPNQANPSAGNVTMDALMVRTTDESGEIGDVIAMSEYTIPIQVHFYDDNNLTAIGNLSSWSIQAQVIIDTDSDGVEDEYDLCPSTAEGQSVNAEGCAWYQLDDDDDGILNPFDQCEGFDDSIDVDNDEIIDGCDDIIDSDNDGVSDDEDQCNGQDDTIDVDNDTIIDCLDPLIDSDGDLVSDEDDLCPGFDDNIDYDNDGIPDDCDPLIDSDGDYISDENDQCEGYDDDIDQDNDGIPDDCDQIIDSDSDGVSDEEDTCAGHDDSIDIDSDGIADGCDMLIDSDNDFVPNYIDICAATPAGETSNLEGCSPSQTDADLDTIMDDVDVCKYTHRGEYDTNPMDGCPDDSDADGFLDEEDACQDSKPDVEIDKDGCEVIPDTTKDEGFMSGATGTVVVGIGSVVAIAIVVFMLMGMRGGGGDEFTSEEETIAPIGPPPSHVGEMRDGHEVTMYPSDSNEWWWKDPSTGDWSRWN
jgi:hypothetical protein